MSEITAEQIQKDREIKSEVLKKLYKGFQDEVAQIEKEQQELLLEIIKAKQDE